MANLVGLGKLAVVAFLVLTTLSCGAVGTTATPTSLPASAPTAVAPASSPPIPISRPPTPLNQSNGRISITNDAASLNGRIKRTWKEVPIVPDVLALSSASGSHGLLLSPLPDIPQAASVTLTLVAEVTPPTVAGQVLQASSVAIKGDFAYVSYNTRGEPYHGAIQVFDIGDADKPILVSEAIFLDSDIHSLAFEGNYVYAIQGTGGISLDTPAGFEVIRSKNGQLSAAQLRRYWRSGLRE